MSSQSRSKQAIRAAKSIKTTKGGGRRAPVKSSRDVPVMAIAVGVILLVVFVGILIFGVINHRGSSLPGVQGSSGTIPCDSLEHTQVHYHVGLQIVYHGTPTPLPGAIGIQGGEAAPSCFYWLHVHSANQNTIHIESPAADTFTLGDFFKIWDTWSTYNSGPHETLSATQVSTIKLATGDTMKIYIDLNDGKGPQLYDGDPTKIQLKAHEVITIVIGPPDIPPSDGRFPQFTFANGL